MSPIAITGNGEMFREDDSITYPRIAVQRGQLVVNILMHMQHTRVKAEGLMFEERCICWYKEIGLTKNSILQAYGYIKAGDTASEFLIVV